MRTRPDIVPRRIRRPGMFSGGDGSTLSLDFTTMSSLDSRFTFSRSSPATFINSSGLVRYADHNLVLNSTMLVSTGWSATTTGGGTVTINNDNTVTFASTAGRATWLQTIGSLQSGSPVTFSIEVTALTNTNIRVSDLFACGSGFTSSVYNYTDLSGNTTANIGAFTTLPGIGLYTVNATTTATSGNIVFGTDCNGVTRTGTVTIARPQLQYGTVVASRVYLANSSTSTANTSTPRFDYDPPTLAPRGLLLEGSATNLALNSESFPSVGTGQWGYAEVTANATKITAPDGTANAIQFNETTNNAIHRINQGMTGSAGAMSVSVWAKVLDTNTPRRLMVHAPTFIGASALFDLDPSVQTGASGSAVAVSGTAANRAGTWVKYPNNWYRVTLIGTYSANNSVFFQINRASSTTATDDTFVGSTSNGLALWGAQVEQGSGASSYIPTGASTVQRAADSCVMTGTNFSSWFTSDGTFYYEFDNSRRVVTSANPTPIALGQYAAGDLVGILMNNGNVGSGASMTVWGSGGTGLQSQTITGGSTVATGNKAAFAFSVSGKTGMGALRNGISAATTTTGTVNAKTILFIGGSGSGTSVVRDWLDAPIQRIKFFPVQMTSAQLQALTA